jgi:ABC-2 type transport system permease protein
VWVLAGSGVMYAMALALASEMQRFPGGAATFAQSLRAGIEAMRPLRWPADRLDTLGGYLTYHNLTLYTLSLCIYAAVQGARAVRRAEEEHSMEEILAAGRPRPAIVRDLAIGFFLSMVLVTLGLGTGIALSMYAGGEPNVSGSFVTVTASGLGAMMAYAAGVLVSQVVASARVAAGLTSLLLGVLYVLTNVWQEVGALGLLRFVSPFYYANLSRALVPGEGADLASMLLMTASAVVLLGLAAWAFQVRDYGAALVGRQARPSPRTGARARVQRRMLDAVWTEALLRGRLGLVAWSLSAAALAALMALLLPTVIEAWDAIKSYMGVVGADVVGTPQEQYLALAGEMITPVVAAFTIAQASGWTADLAQGRVELILSAPMTWSRLIYERLLALAVGVLCITTAGLSALVAGTLAVGEGSALSLPGLLRLGADCLLLGVALGAVCAVAVAALRTGPAVTALAVFVGASYVLGLVAPLFGWPEWVGRLSVFTAFGNPYLEWPAAGGLAVLFLMAVGGSVLAAAVAGRTPKVA